MTIAVVNASSAIEGISTASVSSTPTFTSTTGNLLIALGLAAGATTGEGATPWSDGGTNTFTANPSSVTATGHQMVDIAFVANCTGKTGESATFTISASAFPNVCLLEASGCDAASPNDVAPSYQQTNAAVTTLASSLITPPAGEHLIVVAGVNDLGGTQAVTNAGTGAATWTVIKNDSATGEPFLIAYSVVTANGTSTYGVTYDSGAASNPSGAPLSVGISAFKAQAATAATRDTASRLRLRPGVSLRPSADLSIGGFTTDSGGVTSLFNSVNEIPPSNTSFIQSSQLPVNDTAIFHLPAATDPGVDDGYRLTFYPSWDLAPATGTYVVTVQAGTTDIASRTITVSGSLWQEVQIVMTATEVQSFRANGGFADPRVKFVTTQS